MKQIETRNYRRITKRTARNYYDNGIDIMVVPCKVNPENKHGIGVITNGHYCNHASFDRFINEFTYYNCQYNELGKYPAFYEVK